MDRWPEDYPNAYDRSENLDTQESEALRRVAQYVDDFSSRVRHKALRAPTVPCVSHGAGSADPPPAANRAAEGESDSD